MFFVTFLRLFETVVDRIQGVSSEFSETFAGIG